MFDTFGKQKKTTIYIEVCMEILNNPFRRNSRRKNPNKTNGSARILSIHRDTIRIASKRICFSDFTFMFTIDMVMVGESFLQMKYANFHCLEPIPRPMPICCNWINHNVLSFSVSHNPLRLFWLCKKGIFHSIFPWNFKHNNFCVP